MRGILIHMIVLGIDPGTATTGFGVIRTVGHKREFVDCGVISTPKDLSHAERLVMLHEDLKALLEHHKPERVGVEKLFFATNVTTAMSVGEARGVILFTLQQAGIPLIEFTPLQVKQATTGYGQADKKQIQQMVKKMLKLEVVPKPDDAADALAIALATASNNGMMSLKK